MAIDNLLNVRLLHAAKTKDQWKTVTSYPKKGEVCLEARNTSGATSYKVKIGDNTRPYCRYIGSSSSTPPPLNPDEDWDFTSVAVLPYFGNAINVSGDLQVVGYHTYPNDYSTESLRGVTVIRIYKIAVVTSSGETTLFIDTDPQSCKEIRPSNGITFSVDSRDANIISIIAKDGTVNQAGIVELLNTYTTGINGNYNDATKAATNASITAAIGTLYVSSAKGSLTLDTANNNLVFKGVTETDGKIDTDSGNGTTISITDIAPVQDVKINGTSISSTNIADIAVDGSYDATNNKIATKSTISDAISDLDENTPQGDLVISNNKLQLKGITESNGVIGTSSTASGTAIDIVQNVTTNDSGTGGLSVTTSGTTKNVSHKVVTQNNTDHTNTNDEKESNVISNVSVDSYGHITGVTIEKSTNLIAADIKAPIKKQDDSTWNYRITGGEDITIGEDTARIPSLKGNTMMWNQLVQNGDFSTSALVWTPFQIGVSAAINNHAITITKTTSNSVPVVATLNYNIDTSHKYYVSAEAKVNYETSSDSKASVYFINVQSWSSGTNTVLLYDSNSFVRHSMITSPSNSNDALCIRAINNTGAQNSSADFTNIMFIDLTKMFGSDDQICTALGVANLTDTDNLNKAIENFEKLFPNSYYPYCEGRLVNLGGYGVKWNQMNDITKWHLGSTSVLTPTENTVSGSDPLGYFFCETANLVVSHKYLLCGHYERNILLNGYVNFYSDTNYTLGLMLRDPIYITGGTVDFNFIFEAREGQETPRIGLGSSVTFTSSLSNCMLIDLTEMFGPGSEPTLEEFEAMFPDDYYEYNAGTEMNILDAIGENKLGLESVGFNQLISAPQNIEAGAFPPFNKSIYTRVLGGIVYYFRHDALGVTNWRHIYKIFDLDGNEIKSNAFGVAPTGNPYYNGLFWIEGSNFTISELTISFAKDCYVFFGYGAGAVTATTEIKNTCLNISDSNRNGTYEPYKKDTIDLDWVREIEYTPSGSSTLEKLFPYGLLSAGSVHDEVTETKAIKRVGVVDLGSLTWAPDSNNYAATITGLGFRTWSSGYSLGKGLLSSRYSGTSATAWSNMSDVEIGASTSVLEFKDSSISSSDIGTDGKITKLNGVMLYYELATPIEIPLAETHRMSYVVDDHGTEQQLPINVSSVINAPFVGTFEYKSNFKDTVIDLINRVNAYKNPVRGISDTDQTVGKFAIYDSKNTVHSSEYSHADNVVEGDAGNAYYLPTVSALIDYVQTVLTSALDYKGIITALTGLGSNPDNGDLYAVGAEISVTSSDIETYHINDETITDDTIHTGSFLVWNSTTSLWDVIPSNINVVLPSTTPTLSMNGGTYTIATIGGEALQINTANNDLSTSDITTDSNADGYTFITEVTQTDGQVAAKKKSVRDASTSDKGVVQLTTSIRDAASDSTKVPTDYDVQQALSTALGDYIPLTGSGEITGDLIPDDNETIDLGSSTKKWDNVYSKTLHTSKINSLSDYQLVLGNGAGVPLNSSSNQLLISSYTENPAAATSPSWTNFTFPSTGNKILKYVGGTGTETGWQLGSVESAFGDVSPNYVFAGPASGQATTPSFRKLNLQELGSTEDNAAGTTGKGYLRRVVVTPQSGSTPAVYGWELDPNGGANVTSVFSSANEVDNSHTWAQLTEGGVIEFTYNDTLTPSTNRHNYKRGIKITRTENGVSTDHYYGVSVGAMVNDANITLILNGNFS